MKKLISALGFAALLLPAAPPASAITLSFNPSSQTVGLGSLFSVDVLVTGLDATGEVVSAFDLDVTYDAGILTAMDAIFDGALGGPLDSLNAEVFSSGRIDFAELSFLPDLDLQALQGDSVRLATLQFLAVGGGVSTLAFDGVTFPGIDVKGLNANLLQLNAVNACVGVGQACAQAVPAPATLALLAAGLLLLSFSGWKRTRRAARTP